MEGPELAEEPFFELLTAPVLMELEHVPCA